MQDIADEPICEPVISSYSKILERIVASPINRFKIPISHIYQTIEYLSTIIQEIVNKSGIVDSITEDVLTSQSLSRSYSRIPTYTNELFTSLSTLLRYTIQIPFVTLSETWKCIQLYVTYYKKESESHASIMACINSIIYHTLNQSDTESNFYEMVITITYSILPNLWKTKSSKLKGEITVFVLITFYKFYELLDSLDDADSHSQQLIYDSLTHLNNFTKSDKPLDISEIIITDDLDDVPIWLKSSCFYLKPNVSIKRWMNMLTNTSISYLHIHLTGQGFYRSLKKNTTIEAKPQNDLFKEYIGNPANYSFSNSKIHTLQLFILFSSEHDFLEYDPKPLLSLFISLISENDLNTSGWALLGINRLLMMFPNHDFFVSEVEFIYKFYLQRVHSKTIGPVTCNFIKILLDQKRYHISSFRTIYEEVISLYDSNALQVSLPSLELIQCLLENLPKVGMDKEKVRERLTGWFLYHLTSMESLKLYKYSDIRSDTFVATFLSVLGIRSQISNASNIQYFGVFLQYYNLFLPHIKASHTLKANRFSFLVKKIDRPPLNLSLPSAEIAKFVTQLNLKLSMLPNEILNQNLSFMLSSHPSVIQFLLQNISFIFVVLFQIHQKYKISSIQECLKTFSTIVYDIIKLFENIDFQSIHIPFMMSGITAITCLKNFYNFEGEFKTIHLSILNQLRNLVEKKNSSISSVDSSMNPFSFNISDSILSSIENIDIYDYSINKYDSNLNNYRIYQTLKIMTLIGNNDYINSFYPTVQDLMSDLATVEQFILVGDTISQFFPQQRNISSKDVYNEFLNFVYYSLSQHPLFQQIIASETITLLFIELLKNNTSHWVSNTTDKLSRKVLTACFNVCKTDLGSTTSRFALCSIFSELLFFSKNKSSIVSNISLLIKGLPLLQFHCSFLLEKIFKSIPINQHYEIYRIAFSDLMQPAERNINISLINLYFLEAIARNSKSLLSSVIYDMIQYGDSNFISDQVKESIERVSSNVNGHRNSSELLSTIFDSLICKWMNFNDLFDFPFELFGISEAQFFESYFDTLLVYALRLNYDNSSLQLMSKVASKNLHEHLKQIFPVAYAFGFATILDSQYSNTRDILNMYENWFSKSDIRALINENWIAILVNLFALVDMSEIRNEFLNKQINFVKPFRFEDLYSINTSPDKISLPFNLAIDFDFFSEVIEETKRMITVESDVIFKLSEPQILSYCVWKFLKDANTPVNPSEKILKLRQVSFFLSYLNSDLDNYTCVGLIRSLISLLESKTGLHIEVLQLLEVITTKHTSNLTLDQPLIFNVFLEILLCFFKLKNDIKQMDLDTEYTVSWLNSLINFLHGDQQQIVRYLLDALYDRLFDFNDHIFYSIFLDSKTDESSKKLLILIISYQFSYNNSTFTELFDGINIQSVLPHLIPSADIQVSDEYKIWLARLLARHHFLKGPLEMLDSLASQKFNIDGSDLAYSIERIFEISVSCLFSLDISLIEVTDNILRIFHSKLDKSLRPIFDKIVADNHLENSINFFPPQIENSYMGTSPNIQKLKKELATSFETPSSWISCFELILLNRLSGKYAVFKALSRLIQSHETFSFKVFPYLFHLFLENNMLRPLDSELKSIILECLQNEKTDIKIIQILCDTFLYSRKVTLNNILVAENFLNIDYIEMSKALVRVGLAEHAYMLFELDWSSNQLNGQAPQENLEVLKNEIYEKISDPDMYYAKSLSVTLESTLNRFAYEKNYNRLLQFESAMLGKGGNPSDLKIPLPTSLQKCGLDGISNIVSERLPIMKDLDLYSDSWKLGNWDIPESSAPNNKDEIIYNLLKAYHDHYEPLSQVIDQQYIASFSIFLNSKNILDSLQVFHIIKESEDLLEDEKQEYDLIEGKKSFSAWMEYSRYVCFLSNFSFF